MSPLRFTHSIRQKITFGFAVMFFFMSCGALLANIRITRVEGKVLVLAVLDDLLNKALEIRRYEKNYFLYGQDQDYQETVAFVDALEGLYQENVTGLETIISPGQLLSLGDMITEYRDQIDRLHRHVAGSARLRNSPEDIEALKDRLRTIGRDFTEMAEEAAHSEHREIRELLRTTAIILLFSIVFVLLLGVSFTVSIGMKTVASLQILEDQTRRIASGEYEGTQNLQFDDVDHEIAILLQALNRMTNELRVRQEKLVQSEKLASLGTLLFGVAHELNNPLSNISTSVQILIEEQEEIDPDFREKLLDRIDGNCDRARDIVRSLLEFSRTKDFQKGPLNLKTLVDETILLVRGQVPTEVEIQTNLPEYLKVTANKQRLQQVFINLIGNAVDVLGDSGHIWIDAMPAGIDANGRGLVEIMVSDDGPGIDPHNLKEIFDPFFTTKKVGRGSGLGLFIVHDLVTKNGGSIFVNSRLGEGTTFTIWLPE